MDDDASGLVTFDELEPLIRRKFRVSTAELPDEQLHALWCALDIDGNDHIASTEFGRFMSKAASTLKKDTLLERQRALAEANRAKAMQHVRGGRTAPRVRASLQGHHAASGSIARIGIDSFFPRCVPEHASSTAAAAARARDEPLVSSCMSGATPSAAQMRSGGESILAACLGPNPMPPPGTVV